MKKKQLFWLVLILCTNLSFAQNKADSLIFKMEAFGSLATGVNTPFWMVNGHYGMVSLPANNAYLRGGAFWNHRINSDFLLEAGVDLAAITNHSPSFFAQQLYGSLSYKALNLRIGSKEDYHSMLDKKLSSGDFSFSTNARPIPEINISIPEFTNVPFTKKIVQFKGDFAVGKFLDNSYITENIGPKTIYTINTLLHHKSAFFNIHDPQQHFPFFLTFGFEDCAQWGGWTTYQNTGDLPHSFNDFIKVVLGEKGGKGAPQTDQDNTLGNHLGTYNLKLGYKHTNFELAIYKQHYFEDNSGLEYANWRDGIWGIECALHNQSYVKKVVMELINTTNQSGPIFFTIYDRPIRAGGADNYYNNSLYTSGWSHWGKALGNPLITPPEYNEDKTLGFKDTRIKAYHLGFNGNISSAFSYRILGTAMYAWGDMYKPFLNRKRNISGLIECNYTNPQWKGWNFGIQLASDQGSIYEDNFGCSIKIAKSGIISW